MNLHQTLTLFSGPEGKDNRYALALFLAGTALGLVGWFIVPDARVAHYIDQIVGGIAAGVGLSRLTELFFGV